MTNRADRGIPEIEDLRALGYSDPTPEDRNKAALIAEQLYGYSKDHEAVADELDIPITMQVGFFLDEMAEKCIDCDTWGKPSDHKAGMCRGCHPDWLGDVTQAVIDENT